MDKNTCKFNPGDRIQLVGYPEGTGLNGIRGIVIERLKTSEASLISYIIDEPIYRVQFTDKLPAEYDGKDVADGLAINESRLDLLCAADIPDNVVPFRKPSKEG